MPRDHRGRTIDFGRAASDYERYRPGFPASFFARLADLAWARPGMQGLDLGTGTGSLAIGFAERGLEMTGLDIAPELLEVARERAELAGVEATFISGQAEQTGFDEGSFDLISAGQCWWWFDSDRAAAESRRVLRPGGRLLICAYSYTPLPGNAAQRTEELILEHNPGWPKAGWRGVHPEHVRVLDEAGFSEVESFSYAVDEPFSHEAWRGRIRTCNGVGSALPEDAVERFDRDLAQLLATEFPGQLTVPHRVFAASGLRP